MLFTYDSNTCNFWNNHFCTHLTNMAIPCELITKPIRPLEFKFNRSCITFTIGILKLPRMIEMTIMIVLITICFLNHKVGLVYCQLEKLTHLVICHFMDVILFVFGLFWPQVWNWIDYNYLKTHWWLSLEHMVCGKYQIIVRFFSFLEMFTVVNLVFWPLTRLVKSFFSFAMV